MGVSPLPLKGLNILVVEDQYFVARELTRVLSQLGAAVVGPAARLPLEKTIASKPVDVALLDVQLGCGMSFPLVDEMARRGIPVALITGYGPGVLPSPYRDLLRLDKPVERDKLTAAVLELVDRTEGVAA